MQVSILQVDLNRPDPQDAARVGAHVEQGTAPAKPYPDRRFTRACYFKLLSYTTEGN